MYYVAKLPDGSVEFFSGVRLGEGKLDLAVFADGQGSQALIALRFLLAGSLSVEVGSWSGACISVSTMSPAAGKDLTEALVGWLAAQPGNPLKFQDELTGWLPDAAAAKYLDGLSRLTCADDLRLALGRASGVDMLAPRLAERTGVAVSSAVVETPATSVGEVLKVRVGGELVVMEFPFYFQELSRQLLLAGRPELGWATADEDVVI